MINARAWAVLMASLVLAACGGGDPQLAGTVGQTEPQLVARLGPPAHAVQLSDARLLVYVWHQTAELPRSGPTIWGAAYTPQNIGSPDGFGAQPAQIVTTGTCITQYRVVDGVVASRDRRGSAC